MRDSRSQEPYEVGIPTEVYFGPGRVVELGTNLREREYQNVLVCTDETVAEAGILDRVEQSLRGSGLRYTIFRGVQPNPDIGTVLNGTREATDNAGKDGYDCIVGVGGGGPIDTAKAMSVALTHDGDIRDYVSYTTGQRKPITDRTLPVVAVPTVSGAGAEVSPVAVIVDEEIRVKVGFFSLRLFPVIALVDPTLMVTVPPGTTAGSGMDILAHAFDALVSRRGNLLSDTLAVGAVESVFRYLRRAVRQGDDIAARGALASASIMGLLAIYLGKGGAVHTIGEPLGTICDVPHGYACAVALPAMMRFLNQVCSRELARIYRLAGNDPPEGIDEETMAGRAVEEVETLIRDIALPSLSSIVPDPDIGELADASIRHLAVDRIPVELSRDDYVGLYGAIFSGSR
ncbi:MAG: iron-containing alcohol dehydrogenase [Spirochaetaceae bacterium]|nr:MAG: iron-containing alcohol dehydrogenase [Spirochaetaceae bacterium]